MKVTSFYSVEVNEAEVRNIVKALEDATDKCRVAYEAERQAEDATVERCEKLYDEFKATKELRNSFARLIGRSYMGKDA